MGLQDFREVLFALVPRQIRGGGCHLQGKSLFRTLAACTGPDANCLKGLQAIAGHVVARAQGDDEGKASFAGVAPGVSYVMATAADYGPQTIVWNFRVELKPGQNVMTLSPKNAVPEAQRRKGAKGPAETHAAKRASAGAGQGGR